MIARMPETQFYELAPRIQEMLRMYSARIPRVERGMLIFELADERYEEIVQALTAEKPR